MKDGVKPNHNDGHLVDELHFVKFSDVQFVKFSSIVWTSDSKGFFYKVRRWSCKGIYKLRHILSVLF
jgi:hypothetical protein